MAIPTFLNSVKSVSTITMSDSSETKEQQLLSYIGNHPDIDSLRNNPKRIIDAIDEYSRSQGTHFMTVGDKKGPIVTDLISTHKPEIMIELGCYVGYSAILFGDAVRRAGGQKYYSLELNPEFAAIATKFVELAGLADFVTIIVGRSDVSLNQLSESGAVKQIGLLFIDHYKPAYTLDLKLAEQLGLIVPDASVIVADNVIYPGNPPYLEYVRSSVEQKREAAKKGPVKSYTTDGFAARTVQSYMGSDSVPVFEILGNPNLEYQSVLRQPEGCRDAIEVTRCVGIQESN
ncbi:S-adenosyl-L-methionine-dependent methyltransferase [Aspergillus granulosus]|uniref:catechol O-methyltransferase n=1 Tax=Aspergillus granulosus TaxID=176169 RepID=A0ABR4H0S8_9EURO